MAAARPRRHMCDNPAHRGLFEEIAFRFRKHRAYPGRLDCKTSDLGLAPWNFHDPGELVVVREIQTPSERATYRPDLPGPGSLPFVALIIAHIHHTCTTSPSLLLTEW